MYTIPPHRLLDRGGFEPPILTYNNLANYRNRPLCHLSLKLLRAGLNPQSTCHEQAALPLSYRKLYTQKIFGPGGTRTHKSRMQNERFTKIETTGPNGGSRNRTHIYGFGDHHSTIKLYP